jgi:autotransporter-associated beta strand protein
VIQGRLELPTGEHVIDVSSAGYAGLDIQAQISGFGNFTKTGGGALILSASNSFNSSVTISEGILDVRHNWGLGDTAGSTALSNGVLTLRDVAIGEELLFALGRGTGGDLPGSVLSVVGVASWAGQVALYTNLNIIGGDLAITGPISGEGGLGCFSGGTVQMGGSLPNTYTGPTLSRSPLLVLAKSGGARAISGSVEVGSTSGPQHEVRWLGPAQAPNASVTLHETARINLNGFDDTFGPITFNGGEIETGTGLLGINGLVTANYSSATARINGRIFLNAGYREFQVFDGDSFDDLIVSAVISGPGHLQKTEHGRMALHGANTYTGLTWVDQGVLGVDHPAALGAGNPGTLVAPGASLQLSYLSNPIIGERIALLGHPYTGGQLDVFGNVTLRNQFPAIYECLDLGSNAVVYVGTSDTLIADGFISGTGPWYKYGTGTLVFSNANANTYTGDTIIQSGTLELRKPNDTLAVPGNLVIGPANATAPATVRTFQNGGLNANATVTVNANSLLDLNGYNQSVGRLNLNDGGDVQTGAGTLSFPGGGPVVVGSLDLMGSQASSSFSGRIGLPPNSSLFFTVAPYAPGTLGVTDPELVVSALIPAPVENVNFERAGLYKSGAGEMRLSGHNTFNGRVEVAQGTLSVGSATALGSTFDATYVTGDASLVLINGLTIAGETLSLNSTHTAALHNRGGNNTWTGPIVFLRASNVSVNQDWYCSLMGPLSGPGSLIKVGGGALWLSGSDNNTYAGNTYVHEGSLNLLKWSGQAVPGDLIVGQTNGNTTTLAAHFNHDQIWGNITVNRGGLLDLNGFDELTGVLTLNGGGDVQTGSGTIYPFTSVLVNPGTGGDPSVISGRLGLYQGTIPFTVGAGVSGAGSADCLISATVLQSSANTGLRKNGAGVLRLTGTNSYTGNTTLSGGTLWVDGVQAQSTVLADTGTTLQGSGTVGPIYFVGLNTRFLPGSSPGILTCGGLTPIAPASGTLHVELNGPTPGAGYDQLDVRGPVNLTGLALSASLGFGSAVSNTFTLIQNDGADAVVGTFSGLPQGKKLYVGRELFQISYTGGDGNDVVLTRLDTPPPPTLAIERVATNEVRLLWPTNDPPFSLQTATNLPATNWLAATPPPTVAGTNHVVTNTVTAAHQFYRLSNP